MIGTCCRCSKTILKRCGECGHAVPAEDYMQVGFRLNTLQHQVTPLCRDCAAGITPEDFPTILRNIRATYEYAWAIAQVPEINRRLLRSEQEVWEIIGLAEEIPGLEHGVGPPVHGVLTRDEALARLLGENGAARL